MLPRLRQLQVRFEQELVVIGVHAGKYPNERRRPQLAAALQRMNLHHPIINDRKFRTWRAYGVFAWPTLTLIDPQGRLLGARPGETTVEQWTSLLTPLIAQAESQGTLDRRALKLGAAAPPRPGAALYFPEKLVADQQGRVFISDTGQHRIVAGLLHDHRLRVTQIIGSGQPGAADGPSRAASFCFPRGLAINGRTLYIADTGNHLLRAVDLQTNTVSTVGGTGERAIAPFENGPARAVAIASPWDLTKHGDQLVIAMAGTHQLWLFDPQRGTLGPLVGSGQEDLEDGPLLEAALAQPTGITSDSTHLFWADSEAQAIRRATLEAGGMVSTLVGSGLFDYADKDGIGTAALMQHPQAVHMRGGQLYVADTYNHKIKIVDPDSRACHTWLGRRRIAGFTDGAGSDAAFNEPGGLASSGTQLLIADTNNHALRSADFDTGQVHTIEILGLAE